MFGGHRSNPLICGNPTGKARLCQRHWNYLEVRLFACLAFMAAPIFAFVSELMTFLPDAGFIASG